MKVETPYIKIDYIGYEEELAAQKAKIQKQNEETKRKNEEFYKSMQNYNKQKAEETKAKTTENETKNNSQTANTLTTKETYNEIIMATQLVGMLAMLVIIICIIITIRDKNKCNNSNTNNNNSQRFYRNNFGANNAFSPKYCLTQTEFIFYKHLRKLIKDEYRIDPQIVLSSIINTKHQANWTKINKKTVDFVVRDENFNTHIAIELDDPTHNWKSRQQRDYFVNDVFRDAGIPLIRIKTSNSYEYEIKTRIPKYLLKTEENEK